MTGIFDYIKPTEKIPCPRCKTKGAMAMSEWPGPCVKCKEDPEYIKDQKDKAESVAKSVPPLGGSSYRKLPDVTGIFKDKLTGQDVAVDTKGKRHKIEDTHYDVKKDPHGWKASGAKVADTDSKGRPNL